MASKFPSGIDTYDQKIDNISYVRSQDINDLQDAITAIQNSLGVMPQGRGGLPSLSARISGVINDAGRLIPGSMGSESIPLGFLEDIHLKHGPSNRFSFNGIDVGTASSAGINFGYDHGFTSIDKASIRTHQPIFTTDNGSFRDLTLALYLPGDVPASAITPEGTVTLFAQQNSAAGVAPTIQFIDSAGNKHGLGSGSGGDSGDGGSAIITGTSGDITMLVGDVVYQDITDPQFRWFKAQAIQGKLTNLAVCKNPGNPTVVDSGEFVRFGKITGVSNLPLSSEVYLSQEIPGQVTNVRPPDGIVAYIGTTVGQSELNVAIGVSSYLATPSDQAGMADFAPNKFFNLNDTLQRTSRPIWSGAEDQKLILDTATTTVHQGYFFDKVIAMNYVGDGDFHVINIKNIGYYTNQYDFTRSVDNMFYWGMNAKFILYAYINDPVAVEAVSIKFCSHDYYTGYTCNIPIDAFQNDWLTKIEIPLKEFSLYGIPINESIPCEDRSQNNFGHIITNITNVRVEAKMKTGVQGALGVEYVGFEDSGQPAASKLQSVGNVKLITTFLGNFRDVDFTTTTLSNAPQYSDYAEDLYYSKLSFKFNSTNAAQNARNRHFVFYFDNPIDLSNISTFYFPFKMMYPRAMTANFRLSFYSNPNEGDTEQPRIEYTFDHSVAIGEQGWTLKEFDLSDPGWDVRYGNFDMSKVHRLLVSYQPALGTANDPSDIFLSVLYGTTTTNATSELLTPEDSAPVARIYAQNWVPLKYSVGKHLRLLNIIPTDGVHLADGALYDIIQTDTQSITVHPHPVINPYNWDDSRYDTTKLFPTITRNVCFDIIDNNNSSTFYSFAVPKNPMDSKMALMLLHNAQITFTNVPSTVYYILSTTEHRKANFSWSFGNGYTVTKKYSVPDSVASGYFEVSYNGTVVGIIVGELQQGLMNFTSSIDITDKNILFAKNQTPMLVIPSRGTGSQFSLNISEGALTIQDFTYSTLSGAIGSGTGVMTVSDDNQGARQVGQLIFNTNTKFLKIWTGSDWEMPFSQWYTGQ
jgi:hypothetical protein